MKVVDTSGFRRPTTSVALDLNFDMPTPAGKLVALIWASVAEWEREVIGLPTKEAPAAVHWPT